MTRRVGNDAVRINSLRCRINFFHRTMKSFHASFSYRKLFILHRRKLCGPYTTLPYVALRYDTLGSPWPCRSRPLVTRCVIPPFLTRHLNSGSRLDAVRHRLLWRIHWVFGYCERRFAPCEKLYAAANSRESLGFSDTDAVRCERGFAPWHDLASMTRRVKSTIPRV